MIRNETEYQEAVKRVEQEEERFVQYAAEWKARGYDEQEVTRLLEPLRTFHAQLVEEERVGDDCLGLLDDRHGGSFGCRDRSAKQERQKRWARSCEVLAVE